KVGVQALACSTHPAHADKLKLELQRGESEFGAPYATTMFTSFFGTTITFLIVLPSMNGFTLSDALAAASSVALSAVAGTLITSRNLPFTCTGISSVSSTSRSGSDGGQGW